jgi:hypothetical protein
VGPHELLGQGRLHIGYCGLPASNYPFRWFPLTGSVVVISSQTEQYYAFARDCLQMAEKATHEDVRLRLVELARHWIHAALIEERTARQPAMTSLLRQLSGLNTSSRGRELLRTPIQGQ